MVGRLDKIGIYLNREMMPSDAKVTNIPATMTPIAIARPACFLFMPSR